MSPSGIISSEDIFFSNNCVSGFFCVSPVVLGISNVVSFVFIGDISGVSNSVTLAMSIVTSLIFGTVKSYSIGV